jgi:hypothetical protein
MRILNKLNIKLLKKNDLLNEKEVDK